MSSRTAVTDHPIEPALADRWSPRSFADRPIPEDTVLSLFEAARWAPSANNLQPWAFFYALHGTPGFDRLLGCLKETNALWAGNAGLLVLGLARTEKPDGTANQHARYDLGQAVAHLTFQASALGLHVHQMGGFDPDKARIETDIPVGHDAVTAIAIGHLGAASALPAALQARETAPRTRRPLSEFVFPDRWPPGASS